MFTSNAKSGLKYLSLFTCHFTLPFPFNPGTIEPMPALFIGDNPSLEAVFEDKGSDMCVVITHPHSLMGGNMHNNVVMAAWRASLEKGLSAVRFNFRGVGRSSGAFDNGNGEMNDLASVISYVQKPVIIIGYSFGAWVAAQLYETTQIYPCPASLSPRLPVCSPSLT